MATLGNTPLTTEWPDVDPIFEKFGAPTTAFEFNSSSLVGLTQLSTGAPDVEDADTSVPGCYYIEDNSGVNEVLGRYFATPATPFTAISLVLDSNNTFDNNGGGLFIGTGTPGAMELWGTVNNARTLQINPFTNPTTGNGTASAGSDKILPPFYMAIRVNSTTDVDYLYSKNGWVWREFFSARNPGFTVGSVGLSLTPVTSTQPYGIAYDFIRVWSSALVFVGTP